MRSGTEKWGRSHVLGALRDIEQRRLLATVTVTPIGYGALKNYWSRDHYFIVSDYGDTHSNLDVEPRGLDDVVAGLRESGIPESVTESVYHLTGGYPDVFASVIELWLRSARDRAYLRADDWKELQKQAIGQAKRFFRYLDLPKDSRYRQAIIDLHVGRDSTEARTILEYHPWRKIILNSDGLRSEAVGAAAIELEVKDAVHRGDTAAMRGYAAGIARGMYERQQYAAAKKLMECVREAFPTCYNELMLLHCEVMDKLFCQDADRFDIEWRSIIRTIKQARAAIKSCCDKVAKAERLDARYAQMEAMANAITRAQSGGDRVVDILAGFGSRPELTDRKAALLFLLLKYHSVLSVRSHTTACSIVIAFPEQLYRIWALWLMKVDYYQAPIIDEQAWNVVCEKVKRITFTRPEPGREFGSFWCFAYYTLALATVRSMPTDQCIEPDFEGLDRALSTFSGVRPSGAHSVCICTPKSRAKYFDLIDRWLKCTFRVCLDKVTLEELRRVVEPLPTVSENGTITW